VLPAMNVPVVGDSPKLCVAPEANVVGAGVREGLSTLAR
jgi:hypothetical protein